MNARIPTTASARHELVLRQPLSDLRQALRDMGDKRKAANMKAYMKSAMPYHGVAAPAVRLICRQVFAELDFSTSALWRARMLYLWRNARYREERYCALNLAADKRALALHSPVCLKAYQEMIVTGAWWDQVDPIAQRVGILLQRWPQQIRPRLLAWSRSSNLWQRRVAIISQLHFKEHTDLELLYACIEPSLDSSQFFLRKAIGWALRQYAWTDANEISRFVRENIGRLSPLSRREALKNIGS